MQRGSGACWPETRSLSFPKWQGTHLAAGPLRNRLGKVSLLNLLLKRKRVSVKRFLCLSGVAVDLAIPSYAQTSPQKLESCKPISERTGVEGCWILASSAIGKLSVSPVYWTLDVYPTRASAQAAAGKGSTVLEALGRVWLVTVGDKRQPPSEGSREAEIGPLPVKPNEDYTAQYREAMMQPGAVSRTHRHPGPEIFYTETGESCLETPAGKQVGRKGTNIIAPEGEPMELMATGAETRRGIVLVLHSSSKPHTTLVPDWQSKGLCKADRPL